MPGTLLDRLNRLDLGIRLLGAATICYGIACFLQRDFAIYWQPVPDGVPFRQPLAFVSAGLLVFSGAGLFLSATRRLATIVQIALFLAYFAAYCSVPFKPGGVQPWLGMAEQLAIVVGAATIWARMSPETARRLRFGPAPARIAYGIFSIAFALAHALALEGTARLVPGWFPGDPVFWALFTGAGHFAVGLALIAGRLAIPAARIGGFMYLCFAAVVWLPGAVTHPTQWLRWAGLGITLAMMGALWLVGDYLAARAGEKHADSAHAL